MSHRAVGVLFLSVIIAALAACDRAERREPAGEPAAGEETPGGKALHLRDHGESGEEASEEARAAEPPITERVTAGTAAGEDVEVVEALDVVNDPSRFGGKRVAVSGTVKGFCHHRRAWFAIEVPGASPPYLRVTTLPAFPVPRGVMGATVTVHGRVEAQELPRGRVHHYEQEHRLGSAPDDGAGEAVVRPILVAEGAVFTPGS